KAGRSTGRRKTASPGTSSGITLLAACGLLDPQEAVPPDDVTTDVHTAAVRHLAATELVVGGALHVDVGEDGKAVAGRVAIGHSVVAWLSLRQRRARAVQDVGHPVDEPGVTHGSDRVNPVAIAVPQLGERLQIGLVQDENGTVLDVLFAAVRENDLVQRAIVDGRDGQVRIRVNGALVGSSRVIGRVEDAAQSISRTRTDQNFSRQSLPQSDSDVASYLSVIVYVGQLQDALVLLRVCRDFHLVDGNVA